MINITPYKEINCGDKSIYEHVDENFVVPKKSDRLFANNATALSCYGCI